MLPLYDNVPTKRFPIVTVVLIALNVFVFILEVALPGSESAVNDMVQRTGTIPYEYAHAVDLPPSDYLPFWMTWLSAMFVHGGFVHVAGNMLFLWIFGNNVEDAMGRIRFTAFYLLCGLLAALAQIGADLNERVPAIGASGAIAGVLGAYLILQPRARVLTLLFLIVFIQLIWVPAWILLVVWFALQFIEGIFLAGADGGGVAYFEHIGGFAAGLALVLLFAPAARRRRGAVPPASGPGTPIAWRPWQGAPSHAAQLPPPSDERPPQ